MNFLVVLSALLLLLTGCGGSIDFEPEYSRLAPTILPNGGMLERSSTVVIESPGNDGVIYYTLDGSVPDADARRYSGPFRLTEDRTVRARVVYPNALNSPEALARFTLLAPAPKIHISQKGDFVETVSSAVVLGIVDGPAEVDWIVDLSALPGKATITEQTFRQFILQWQPPSQSAGTYQLKVRAQDALQPDRYDELVLPLAVRGLPVLPPPEPEPEPEPEPVQQLAAPVIQPVGGMYPGPQQVSLSVPDGVIVFYTLDGTDPDINALRYQGSFELDRTLVVRALAWREGFLPSSVSVAAFEIGNAAPAALVDAPRSIQAGERVTILVHGTDPDGEPPSLSAQLENLPGTVDLGSPTSDLLEIQWQVPLDAKGTYFFDVLVRDARFQDLVVRQSVALEVAALDLGRLQTPQILPAGGDFLAPVTVSVAPVEETVTAVQIFYTLDGSTPNTESTLYAGAFEISGSLTVKVLAHALGYEDSAVARSDFRIGNVVPVLTVPETVSATAGDQVQVSFRGSDDDGAPPILTGLLDDLPGNAALVEVADGEVRLEWQIPADVSGLFSIPVQAQDARFDSVRVGGSLEISVAKKAPAADVYLQASSSRGLIAMEAEAFREVAGGANGELWGRDDFNDPRWRTPWRASADSHLTSMGTEPVGQGAVVEGASRADYQILFDRPGTYYLWLRGRAPSTQHKVHVGLNGEVPPSGMSLDTFGVVLPEEQRTALNRKDWGDWAWSGHSAIRAERVTIEVPTAGEHTLNLWLADSQTDIDRIVLTSDQDFVPVEFGPQSNLQGTLPVYSFVEDSQVAAWSFDEAPQSLAVVDAVSEISLNCDNCPASVPGLAFGAYEFDGSTGLNSDSVAVLDVPAGRGFAVETLLRVAGSCTAEQGLISRGRVDRSHWSLRCKDGVVSVSMQDGTGRAQELSGLTRVDDGLWHHVVLVRDTGFAELRLYVDGREDATADLVAAGDITLDRGLRIGLPADRSTETGFTGRLDGLVLHNRALRESEILRQAQVVFRGLQRNLWSCETPVQIMPLGDSITAGTNGSGLMLFGNYRSTLHSALSAAGYNVDFTGSRFSRFPNDPDPHHEGWPGYDQSHLYTMMPGLLDMNPPELMLLHIGTNRVEGTTAMGRLLDKIYLTHPELPIVVGRILNRIVFHEETRLFNVALGETVLNRIAAGRPYYLVDHESALEYPADMQDTLHPNQDGADKMAMVWLEALAGILPVCRPASPFFVEGIPFAGRAAEPFEAELPVFGHPQGKFELLDGPEGLVLNSETGVLFWSSPSKGSSVARVRVSNAYGAAEETFNIQVE